MFSLISILLKTCKYHPFFISFLVISYSVFSKQCHHQLSICFIIYIYLSLYFCQPSNYCLFMDKRIHFVNLFVNLHINLFFNSFFNSSFDYCFCLLRNINPIITFVQYFCSNYQKHIKYLYRITNIINNLNFDFSLDKCRFF